MRVINRLFVDMLDGGIIILFDDILIYSKYAESQFSLLNKVFKRLGGF